MHGWGLACGALALLPAALADRPHSGACNNNRFVSPEHDRAMRRCYWYPRGTLACGTSNYHLTERSDGYALVAWTRDEGIDELYAARKVSAECLREYGYYCVGGGYRELWCRVEP